MVIIVQNVKMVIIINLGNVMLVFQIVQIALIIKVVQNVIMVTIFKTTCHLNVLLAHQTVQIVVMHILLVQHVMKDITYLTKKDSVQKKDHFALTRMVSRHVEFVKMKIIT